MVDRNLKRFFEWIKTLRCAEKITWEFNKQEVKDEDDGLDNYEIKLNWVREEFDDSDEE